LLAYTWTATRSVWPVFCVLMLFGSARAFLMPSSQAILINLVPSANFSQAVALNSSTFHLAVVLGPVLGGVLYLAGPHVAYVVSTALLAVSVALLLAMRVRKRPTRAHEPSSWHALFEGLRFVGSRPIVLGAISLDLFAVLFGGATALLPAYARDVLDIGPTGLGLLRTAPAAGAALTAGALTLRPISTHVGRWMFGGVAVFGIATIVFACSTSAVLSFVALAATGAGDMVSVYIRHILVQLATPDSIRGRVSAVNAVFIGASNELGEFESGVTARWFGLVRSVVIGGLATLVVTGAWMSLFPQLRRMRSFPESLPEQSSPD
jgi:MFS family permease